MRISKRRRTSVIYDRQTARQPCGWAGELAENALVGTLILCLDGLEETSVSRQMEIAGVLTSMLKLGKKE
jgi:hypothetical protein